MSFSSEENPAKIFGSPGSLWRQGDPWDQIIKMRIGDLKLPKMAEKIPTKKARREVDQYFAQMMKEIEAKKSEKSPKRTDQKKKTETSKKKTARSKKQEDGQLNLFDYFEG